MDVHHSVGIGSDFLGYRIEELVGGGGMGVVYRAYDLRLKRPVALKLVTPDLAQDERFRERFARESELVMSLEHPNVVPIYDAGEVDGRVYLAMRLVDGTDLGSLLRTGGALEPARAMVICTQIAAALDAAHARGLVHRDVKPSNVLLDSSGHVYLADFGLTRRFDDEVTEAGEDRFVGTPAYLAPEQVEGRTLDGRSDVYSLGCVLFECLTGEQVFVRSSRLAVAWAHLEEAPPLPSRRRTGLPEAIDAVVGRSLAKEPEQRFPTCGALVTAADQALGLGKRASSGRRRVLLLAGAVIVSIAGAAIVIARTPGHSARRTAAAPAPLFAGPNTLARIDPATNKVSKVVEVGIDPVLTAAGGNTVWVYNRVSESIAQVDASTNRRVDFTPVSIPVDCCGLSSGPVLAADASGAWFVAGASPRTGPLLVHIPVGHLGKHEYPLPTVPTGVAVGGGYVWVVGHGPHGDDVLRINRASGRVTRTVHFPSSARIDSIAFGFGAVWIVSSSTAMLYKIDPRTARVTTKLRVGHSRATRPEIMQDIDKIYVRVTGAGGTTYVIDPSPLSVDHTEVDGPPGNFENVGRLKSQWWYDSRAGDVERQAAPYGPITTIRVTGSPVMGGGPCLTSITAGARSLWVTAATSSGAVVCTR